MPYGNSRSHPLSWVQAGAFELHDTTKRTGNIDTPGGSHSGNRSSGLGPDPMTAERHPLHEDGWTPKERTWDMATQNHLERSTPLQSCLQQRPPKDMDRVAGKPRLLTPIDQLPSQDYSVRPTDSVLRLGEAMFARTRPQPRPKFGSSTRSALATVV